MNLVIISGLTGIYIVSIHKWSVRSISALCSNFARSEARRYPRNTQCIHPKGTSCGAPVVKIFACLDLKQTASFLDEHRLSNETRTNGFTLLEILISIFLFAVIITTAYGSYNSLSTQIHKIHDNITPYEMANLCLNRMRIDLESVFVTTAPGYSIPNFDKDPDPFRITGGKDASDDSRFSILRFTSNEHLTFGSNQHNGVAEIVYYVQETSDKKYVLRRSDNIYPYPSFEKKNSDPVLCKDLRSVNYLFFDSEGKEYDSWNSDSSDYNYATPRNIGIKIELGDDTNPLLFETKVILHTYRKEKN